MAARSLVAAACCLMLSAGCMGPVCRNTMLPESEVDGQHRMAGYRFEALDAGRGNTDDLLVCLTFSGGGMRAAALAYGVLLGLKETTLPPLEDQANLPESSRCSGPRSLLDEVDIISAVSGGAFTALAYGFWKDDLFDGRYEKRFLKHNVQRDLISGLWKPRYLFRLPWVLADRTDYASQYYDRELFEGATYADLLKWCERPFIVVNATNMALGDRFEFTQDDFDLLGSDLQTLPLGTAAAASSAYPILLSPLRMRYFAEPESVSACTIEEVMEWPENRPPGSRQWRWAVSLMPHLQENEEPHYRIDGENHRYLYLLDGGLADNLGLGHLMESYHHRAIRDLIDSGKVSRLLIIIVDAGAQPPEDLEKKSSAPGIFRVLFKTSTTGIDQHSHTMANTVRYLLRAEQPRRRQLWADLAAAFEELRVCCPDAACPTPPYCDTIEAYVVDVKFRKIEDQDMTRALSIITSLGLPAEDVQMLIEKGRQLLLDDQEFQRLLWDLRGETQE